MERLRPIEEKFLTSKRLCLIEEFKMLSKVASRVRDHKLDGSQVKCQVMLLKLRLNLFHPTPQWLQGSLPKAISLKTDSAKLKIRSNLFSDSKIHKTCKQT